jgi:hypothetical protein
VSEQNGGSRLDRIEKLIEKSERANQAAHERVERGVDRVEKGLDRTEKELRKWVKIGVAESLRRRKAQREIDENITRLSAAQLITEEKLAAYLSSLGRRNGH